MYFDIRNLFDINIYPMVGFGKDIEVKSVDSIIDKSHITSSVIDKPYITLNVCIEISWISLI
jgi:hypothetical protein